MAYDIRDTRVVYYDTRYAHVFPLYNYMVGSLASDIVFRCKRKGFGFNIPCFSLLYHVNTDMDRHLASLSKTHIPSLVFDDAILVVNAPFFGAKPVSHACF